MSLEKLLELTHGTPPIVSPYVNDYHRVRRTWKERLFTWPWRPFTRTKSVYAPIGYFMFIKNQRIITVSPRTYEALVNGHDFTELDSIKETEE